MDTRVPFRCIDIHQFHFQTIAQYEAWVRAHNRNIRTHGMGLEGFFYDPNTGTVDVQAAVNAIQDAIDEGKKGLGLGKTHGHDFPHLSHEPEPEPSSQPEAPPSLQEQGNEWDCLVYTNFDYYRMGRTGTVTHMEWA
jgi:hypothetical protein